MFQETRKFKIYLECSKIKLCRENNPHWGYEMFLFLWNFTGSFSLKLYLSSLIYFVTHKNKSRKK